MKSELNVVRGLAIAIWEDLYVMYPSIESGLRRSLLRLQKADQISGLPLYTIVLPSLSKYLERSLDEMGLLNSRPPFLGALSRVDKRPRFLYDLWALIFEADGTLRRDCSVDAIASLRQVFLFAKKLTIECEERYTNDTIQAFREIERSLPEPWDDTWTCDSPRWAPRTGHPLWGECSVDGLEVDLFDSNPMHDYDLDLDWGGFRNFVARITSQFGPIDHYGLRPSDYDDCGGKPLRSSDPFVLHPKHGPGAVSDRYDGTKYDLPYWTQRLESVFPYDFFGCPNSGFTDRVRFLEFPSRLHAVPKTQSGPRLIAAEPTAHQWVQGAVARWLEQKIAASPLKACIDFRNQEASRHLAREASRSRMFATVDLSSASDRLTCRLVEFCFQSNRSLLDALHACRTRAVSMSFKGNDDSDIILLRKFSTQGSAVTFPVQTIVFTYVALWACALTFNMRDFRNLGKLLPMVRVFGDDIIVPTDAYPVLVRLLTSLRLKVNESKSFAHGYFRESCGMDAYAGSDVTPAYLRQVYSPAPDALESVLACSNNFFLKGWWNASDYISRTVPVEELKKLPIIAAPEYKLRYGNRQGIGARGLVSFCGDLVSHLPKRWNPVLQRDEYKMLCISTHHKRVRGTGHGDLNQFFYSYRYSESLVDITPYSGGQIVRTDLRKKVRWVSIDEIEGLVFSPQGG